jgi:hypothetical protein
MHFPTVCAGGYLLAWPAEGRQRAGTLAKLRYDGAGTCKTLSRALQAQPAFDNSRLLQRLSWHETRDNHLQPNPGFSRL